jgi:integrase
MPAVPTRSPETDAQYLAEGGRHLRRAQQRHPEIKDQIEALLVGLENDETILKGSACRAYKAQHMAIIDKLLAGQSDPEKQRATALMRIKAALARRRGRPPQARTSSLKVTDATEEEVLKLLRYLAKRARGQANPHPVCMLAMYMYFVPRTGCRPVEWSNAAVEGSWLIVQSAKFSNGRSGFESRKINLAPFPSKVIEAAAVFSRCVRESIAQFKDFEHWRNAIAELLARCCKALKLRRLSLYSLRHVALATWARAGVAPWEIAALAGHASLNSARHYAGARHGWTASDGIAAADPARVAALQERHATASISNTASAVGEASSLIQANSPPEEDFDFSMPEPPKPETRVEKLGQMTMQAWVQNMVDKAGGLRKSTGQRPLGFDPGNQPDIKPKGE